MGVVNTTTHCQRLLQTEPLLKSSNLIMSGKGQSREVVSKGTNSQGNEYTSYSDGAYRYKNETSTGGNTKYYNTGSGHGFYENKGGSKESGGQPYKTHYNYNQGTSNNF